VRNQQTKCLTYHPALRRDADLQGAVRQGAECHGVERQGANLQIAEYQIVNQPNCLPVNLSNL
jgi:uncharacterized protein YjbI with pentapeptide repeats